MTSEATFAGLPRELKNQILGRTDLLDLARLRVVSPSMRDAVDEMMEDRRDAALAAKLGRLTVLKNLLQRGKLKKVVVCESAAEGGHLETLKWARENDCPWDERTCAFAAKGGHLEMLKWLRENDCPWDYQTCAYAAKGGHLEVLKWARESGCPWNELTCEYAAEAGHLEILKWARENGCPWDEETCACAALRGHLEVLKWARENGCPWDWWIGRARKRRRAATSRC